jgi:hypothetical protein
MAAAFFDAAFGLAFRQDAMRPAPGGFPPPVCEAAFSNWGILNLGLPRLPRILLYGLPFSAKLPAL